MRGVRDDSERGSRRRRSTTRSLPQSDTSHHQNAQRRHLAPAAVLIASRAPWTDGESEGSVTTEGDLPNAKQLKVGTIPTRYLVHSTLTAFHRMSSTTGTLIRRGPENGNDPRSFGTDA